jgi:hypothetical protein
MGGDGHREEGALSDDGLVCAYCSGLVAHGGCASCRAARERLQRERVLLPAGPLLALAAVLTVLLVLLAH